ncbi:hypothetical protein D3C81_1098790 [compost metagenome]
MPRVFSEHPLECGIVLAAITCMVKYNIYHYFDSSIVCSIKQAIKILQSTQMFIDFSKITSPITMVSVLPRIGIHHMIHIVYDRCNPDCIDAESAQVIQFGYNTCKIAAMIGFGKSFVVTSAIVEGVSIKESVS